MHSFAKCSSQWVIDGPLQLFCDFITEKGSKGDPNSEISQTIKAKNTTQKLNRQAAWTPQN